MNTYHPFRQLLVFVLLLVLCATAVGFPNVPESAFSQNPIRSQLIESDAPIVLQNGQWQTQSAASASGGTYLYNAVPASSTFDTAPTNVPALLLNFTGPSVEILYTTGPSLGILAVEVDDVVLRTVITTADTTHYQQRVVLDYLTDEPHTLRVYPAQGTIAIDAFIAPLPPPEPDTIAAAPTCPPVDTPQLILYRPDGTVAWDAIINVRVSADGRYVAFVAGDIGLVPNDTNGHDDIFVRDMHTCTTEIISVTPTGGPSNYDSSAPVISPDGRYVTFDSGANNLVAGDPNPPGALSEVFLRDRQTGITSIASLGDNGQWGNDRSANSSISADGRFVTFMSPSNNLVPDDTNACSGWVNGQCMDIFLRDRQEDTLRMITRRPDGGPSNGWVNYAFISADGNWIVYRSEASDLVPGDTNGVYDVFLYDRINNQTTRISVANDGTQANGESYPHGISADGRYVLIRSRASNLVPNDLNGGYDAFVYDALMGQIRRVSVASNGNEADAATSEAAMSGNGRYVAFHTSATNLAAGDTNNTWDVFIHDLQTGQTMWASAGIGTGAGLAGLAADGQWIAFRTTTRLHPDDTQDPGVDIYIVPVTTFPDDPPPPPVPADTLAVFNPTTNMLSRVDTLVTTPPPTAYTTYSTGRTTTGQWLMGDWDGDGHDSPAQFRLGAMIYTNDQTTTTNWVGIWLGPNGYPVAGRFDPTVNHDCVGVVDSFEFPPWGTGFALYFTCDLTSGVQPPLDAQWLSILLPTAAGFSGTHQFSSGDFDGDGVDTIAVRRGRNIAWTNVHPTELLSAFDQAQYFRPLVYDDPEGYFVVGDWDSDGRDNFGLYHPDGIFYYKLNLAWNSGTYLYQEAGLPVGTPATAASWR